MSWLASASTAPWERALSWTLILAVWQTSLLALLVRGAFHFLGRPGPRQRYAVAWTALWVALLCAGASLWVVLLHPVSARQTFEPLVAPATRATRMLSALPHALGVPPVAMEPQASTGGALHPLHWMAWLWMAVVLALGCRLLGGWLLARRVLSQATPATNPVSSAAFARLVSRMDVPRHVRLLESPDVDAPVTVRWRQPAVVFPRGLVGEIVPDAFEALAAHELAHVERRDYLASLAQTVPSTLLFFSPATHWLSARVREAREQCCDDRAVEVCGRSSTYVAALGALAERGYALGVGVLGAAPRVADRMRRLAQGDTTMTMSPTRWWTLATAVIAFGLVAAGTGAASLFDVTQTAGLEGGPAGTELRCGYLRQQPQAPITISGTTQTSAFAVQSVRIRNVAELPIASVTLVAAIAAPDGQQQPVLVASRPLDVELDPGGAIELTANLLSPAQAAAARERLGTRKVQAMLAVLHVAFADGSEWRVLPRTGARTIEEAFYMPTGGVAASHTEKGDAHGQATGNELCSDDVGFPYSPGAIVPVMDQPGALARCMHGRWVGYELTPSPR
jgi:Zn-dependent protease with chaperone function